MPDTFDWEAYVQVPIHVLPMYSHASFQLDLECMIPGFVIGEKIWSMAIVLQPSTVVSKIGQQRNDLLKVM